MIEANVPEVDWDTVVEATYMVRQRFRYDYPGPIVALNHRLIVVPRDGHADQRRIAHTLSVTRESAPGAVVREFHDAFGNAVVLVLAARVERFIEFDFRSIVRRRAAPMHYVCGDALRAAALHGPTELTRTDAALDDAARDLLVRHQDPFELADALNAFVFGHMRYAHGLTDVSTPAARAFELGRGVCQDYAHVMLALARRCGLAARYVSGHLLGEGGTHAWVELIVPSGNEAVVLAFDPTHGRRVTMKYVVVAVGRDYSDVAPTSGSFVAPYSGELSTQKCVEVVRLRHGVTRRAAS